MRRPPTGGGPPCSPVDEVEDLYLAKKENTPSLAGIPGGFDTRKY